MKDRDGFDLEMGDYVLVTPDKDNLAQNEFAGFVESIYTDSHGNEIARVKDQEENVFECESHELEKLE